MFGSTFGILVLWVYHALDFRSDSRCKPCSSRRNSVVALDSDVVSSITKKTRTNQKSRQGVISWIVSMDA